MIDNAYRDSVLETIVEKQMEIEILKKKTSDLPLSMQRVLFKARIVALEEKIETLIHMLNGEETVPTKEDILQLIDKALDERNEEEFMKLTSLLKVIK